MALENLTLLYLRNGECSTNVTDGRQAAKKGPLSLKRELREIEKLLSELEAAIQNEQSGVGTWKRNWWS